MDKYKNSKDEEIISIIQKSVIEKEKNELQDYMITRYKNLVKTKSRAYFIIGADKEDIIQEGMIGLYKAIRDFNCEKQVSFYSFAELCITRQIITAIKAATRKKHSPLNSYVSLNKPMYETENGSASIEVMLKGNILSPEELLIDRENKNSIEYHMGKDLSDLEYNVLVLYLRGKSYSEIAKSMRKEEKSIDNAIQRVRKKVGKILTEKIS